MEEDGFAEAFAVRKPQAIFLTLWIRALIDSLVALVTPLVTAFTMPQR